jgi:hypothetical protein
VDCDWRRRIQRSSTADMEEESASSVSAEMLRDNLTGQCIFQEGWVSSATVLAGACDARCYPAIGEGL